MTIAYIVEEYPSLTETFIVREIRALIDAGLAVRIFALKPSRDAVAARQEGVSGAGVRFAPSPLHRAGVMLHANRFRRRPGRYLATLAGSLSWNPLAPRRMVRSWLFFHRVQALAHFVESEGIDHLHAQFAFVNARIAKQVARLTGVAFSIGVHAWDIYAQSEREVMRILAGATFISCCTMKGVETLRAMLPAARHPDIVLVRHGLAVERVERNPDGKAGLILAVGRLVRKKGFCYLIDACHILAQKGIPFNCLIVGQGPLEAPLRRMIDHLDLSNSVRIVGAMPQASVGRLLASETGIFALPSVVADDGDRDGLPNVVLEAMAAAVPVVTTTASAACEAIEDGRNGILTPPEDSEAIAERIAWLLQNPAERARLGAAARETIAQAFVPGQCVKPLMAKFDRRARPA